MVLMSVIGLMVVMIYSGVTNTWLMIENRADLNQSLRHAMNRISLEVRMAHWVFEPERKDSGDRIRFETPAGSGVLYEVRDGSIYRSEFDIVAIDNWVLKSEQRIARSVTGFSVERLLESESLEKTDVLLVGITAELGEQAHELQQYIKLRNIN